MKQLLDLYDKILKEGVQSTDRTGVGTIKLIGQQMRFDLSKGFPAVTTKRLAWKAMVSELLWFIEGSHDERRLCEILHGTRDSEKKTIWSDNCLDRAKNDPNRFNGEIVGNMYGMNWRYQPSEPHSYQFIKRKSYIDDYVEKHVCPEITSEFNGIKIHQSATCGEYEVVGKQNNNIVIRFLDTGSYKIVKRTSRSIKDFFKPSIEGVGYLGGVIPDTLTARKLYQIWKDMIIRVYNPRKNHVSYKDVTVCKRWHNFMNFYNDSFSLWGFQEFVDSGYSHQLDKDYYGSNIYSPDTCIFISSSLNKTLNGGGYGFKIYIYKDNIFYSITDLQKYRGLSRKAQLPKELTILEDNETHVVRPKIYIDQLQRCIDLIKNDPDSRRIVITSWNSRDIENAALGMCHPLVQWFVINGKLSCIFYMRSTDSFLGLPFNIASYALLTHMIAQITGLEVGELIYNGGDCHIYLNHIEQVKEQLQREPIELPKLWLDPTITDIESFTMGSFKLLDYNPMPTIKAPMAV
ncbi:hypothetical protein [Klebsiella phage phiKp_21]|nr:hypothetical protein [Klebsiella phage phiKp_21]